MCRKINFFQIQYTSRSVRKVKIYIENVLDGKYVLHNTHGINYIKHNLEYGYQVIGLIKSTKDTILKELNLDVESIVIRNTNTWV